MAPHMPVPEVRAVTGRTFPALLVWVLVLSPAVFLMAYAAPYDVAFLVLATGVAFSGLASVVALFYLFRGGYFSALNVLLTLVGAIPFGLAVAVLLFLIFGHVHM